MGFCSMIFLGICIVWCLDYYVTTWWNFACKWKSIKNQKIENEEDFWEQKTDEFPWTFTKNKIRQEILYKKNKTHQKNLILILINSNERKTWKVNQ